MKEMEVIYPQEVASSMRLRSNSDTDYRMNELEFGASPTPCHHLKMDLGKSNCHSDIKKKLSVDFEVQSSLKQEILQLEKRLKDQLAERHTLEKALGYRIPAMESSNKDSAAKPAKELIREIALLELEVMHLEQYLLSLYRKSFDQQSALSPTAIEKSKQPQRSQGAVFREAIGPNDLSKRGNQGSISHRIRLSQNLTNSLNETCSSMYHDKFAGPGVYRSHSALSYRSARMSPPPKNLARALESFHSQPLYFLEDEQNATQGEISLAEYLGTNIADHVPETPNKISENMVRCMGTIYCKLADPPLVHHGISSPTSSFSSASAVSPQNVGDLWSPCIRRESILDSRLINPFRVDGLKEFSGPYSSMVEVPFICRDGRRIRSIQDLLRNYKSLVDRLASVNIKRMKNEEKLAFWINVHNAMMMHAYLNYGIPRNNTKRQSLFAKAAYDVGGCSISAETIRVAILGFHMHCSRQWLRTLLSPRIKFRSRDERRAYAMERSEPLLHFALCSGSHSDPAVRIYTPKRLFRQLESAKEEFIRAAIGIRNEHKILLPKMLDSYAKESGLTSQGVVDLIQNYLPETLRRAMRSRQQGKSHHKIIEWVPHNLTFRYLLSKELINAQ